MAQGKVHEAGAPMDVQGRGVPLPAAAVTAYGCETGGGRPVVLAKLLLSGAGLDDLPEELRRQVAGGGGGQGAAATGPGAPALRGEGAARENAAPIFVLLLDDDDDDSHNDGLVYPGADDAVPLLHGGNRAAKDGAHYYYYYYSDVVVPPPEDLMPAAVEVTRSSTHAVQVLVDAAAAADPIAAGVNADAGHERGNLAAMAEIVAASSAATALAAGAVGPATALGLFAVLVGGLSLAMASVRAL